MWAVDTIEWACILCGHRSQNERVEQRICIRFCVKLEHSSVETFWMIQKTAAMGNWWLAASSQHAHSRVTYYAEFLVKHQITQVTQLPYSPDLEPCDFCFVSKTKITFERWVISDHDEIQENTTGQLANGDWENYVRSRGASFEGDWGVIVLCTMFLVSCVFFNKCLYFSYDVAGYLLDKPHT